VLKRRLLSLTATAIMAGSATVLAGLPATGASGATAEVAAGHSTPADTARPGATASQGKIHIVRRGLVRDCEDIVNLFATEAVNGADIIAIAGNGVNEPVTLKLTGNCFNLYNEFTTVYGTTVYTGYEYQNGEGHCLWADGATVELGAACKAGHPNESFFGVKYNTSAGGWEVADVTEGPNYWMDSSGCADGFDVQMVYYTSAYCAIWNFPSS
jgi:hypothetical protein